MGRGWAGDRAELGLGPGLEVRLGWALGLGEADAWIGADTIY